MRGTLMHNAEVTQNESGSESESDVVRMYYTL